MPIFQDFEDLSNEVRSDFSTEQDNDDDDDALLVAGTKNLNQSHLFKRN